MLHVPRALYTLPAPYAPYVRHIPHGTSLTTRPSPPPLYALPSRARAAQYTSYYLHKYYRYLATAVYI